MSSSYTLTQQEFTRLKRRLTYRKNRLAKAEDLETIKKEVAQLTKEVDYAMAIFEEKGYPDNWHAWERAKEDAKFAHLGARTMGGGQA